MAATLSTNISERAAAILDAARHEFSSTAKSAATYHDYERFKRQLHDAGAFGYESQLADILNL